MNPTLCDKLGNFRKWENELMPVFLISVQMLLWVNQNRQKAAMMLPLLLQLVLGAPGKERRKHVGLIHLAFRRGKELKPKISNSGLAIRCYSDHAGPNSAGGIETCDEGGVCSSSRIIFRWEPFHGCYESYKTCDRMLYLQFEKKLFLANWTTSCSGKKGFSEQQCRGTVCQELQTGRKLLKGASPMSTSFG